MGTDLALGKRAVERHENVLDIKLESIVVDSFVADLHIHTV